MLKTSSNLCILLTAFLVGACLYIPVDAYSVTSFNITSQDAIPLGLTFSNDGEKMFVIGSENDKVYEYVLHSPFNLTSSIFANSFYVGTHDGIPQGITFSNNGAKMFIVGYENDRVYEYTLSVPFNVTSSTFTSFFPVSSQDTLPSGITFSNNGTKMFIVGYENDRVYEYTLSVPFSVTSSIFASSLDVSSQDDAPQGVAFSNDGTRMFITGDQNDRVYEYTLSVPFNVTSSTFVNFTSVSSQDNTPSDIAFSNDGTKMFVTGDQNNKVYEYALPAPFDLVDTNQPTFTAQSDSDTQTTVTFSEGISGTLKFSEWSFDGNTAIAVSGYSNDNMLSGVTELVFTYSITSDPTPDVEYTGTNLTDSSFNGLAARIITATDGIIPAFTARLDYTTQTTVTFSEGIYGTLRFSEWSFDGNTAIAVSGYSNDNILSGVTELVFTHSITSDPTPDVEYTGTTLTDSNSNGMVAAAVTVSGSIPITDFSVSSVDNTSTGVAFSNDGTSMFVIGSQIDRVYEYTLSVPFIVSSSTFADYISVSSQDDAPQGIAFSNDGTRMFITGDQNDRVYEYTLSVPFNVTSSIFASSLDVSSQDDAPQGIAFSNDGTRMFITGDQNDRVYEYTLSVPFNVTSSIFASSLDVSSQDDAPQGVAFSNDGTRMFVTGDQNDRVYEYTLSVPFNVTSSTFTHSLYVGSKDTFPQDITFSNDGTRMFIVGNQNDNIYAYTLSATFNIILTTPTFIAQSNSGTQTTVIFSEEISGTLTFSEWSFHGRTATAVVGYSNGDTLSGVTELVFTHNITIDQTPDAKYTGTSLAGSYSNVMFTATVTAHDRILPTFTTHADSATQTTVTFSERIYGTLTFSEWSLDGNAAILVLNHGNGDTIHGVPKLILTHSITSDQTPNVKYIGTNLTDSNSNVMAATTVTASDGILPTFVAKSYSGTQTTVTFSEGISGTLRYSEWSFNGNVATTVYGFGDQFNVPTVVTPRGDGVVLSDDIELIFMHDLTSDRTPDVEYTGTGLTDSNSNTLANLSVTAVKTVPISKFEITSTLTPYPSITSVTFSDDGGKMFVYLLLLDLVQEYALSVPFNVTSATYTDNFTVSRNSTGYLIDIAFYNDGTKMFTGVSFPSSISEYALSVPFNVTSSIYSGTFYIDTSENSLISFTFSNDGSKMFTVDNVSNRVSEYALSVPFNVTSSTFTDYFYVGLQTKKSVSIAFSNDGSKMFIMGSQTMQVYEYALSVPFNVTSSTFTDSFYIGSQDNQPADIAFSNDGTKLFITASQYDNVYEYALSAPFDLVDTDRPTFTAQSDFGTQTTVTFSEEISGTLTFSEWSFDGNVATTVVGYGDGDTLSDITKLIFTHDITNDQTPSVIYTGSTLIDRSSNGINVGTVTTFDGTPQTITDITSDAATLGTLEVGETITFTMTTDRIEAESTITSTYNLQPLIWNTVNNGTIYTATYTVTDGEPDQTTPLQITNVTITDGAGNTSLPFNGTDILKTIDANSPQFLSSTLNEETGVLEITFNEMINISTLNSTGFSIRNNNTSMGDVTLSTLELNTVLNGTTVSFNMTLATLRSIIAFTTSVLDIDAGAVRDMAGNAITTSTNNAITTTFDTTPPIITLLGDDPQTIEQGAGYTELGATTSDGSPVTINSTEFIDTLGVYYIYYDSTDASGNDAIRAIRTVFVSDNTKPIITLNGSNPQMIELGDGYTELGAITDDGSFVTINFTGFIDALGTYFIYYDSIDSSGNIAIQVNRTVIVSDPTPPIITLLGNNPQIIEQGAGYTELGATTNDGSTVTINSANFTDAVGTYTIYYDSVDISGNNAIQVNRTVIVSDPTPPIISLLGDNPQTIEQGAGYTELNATTSDGSTVTINTTEFADLVGTYHIYYDSTDTAGNNAIQVNRTVIVSDTTSPVISLLGDNPQTIEQGAGYTELNATTSDGSTVTINTTEFADLVGTYTIYYDSTDTAGNNAIQVNRTVIVSDTTSPIISLLGDNPQTIEQGAGYTELGATTSDGSTVTINTTEFADLVGTYTIYYDSTDTAGNNAIQVNRTVIVSDPTPPIISLLGDNPQTIEQGAGYTELGATTSDGSTVTINTAEFADLVGTYTIYYDSTDTAGNNAIQVNRTVIVSDTTSPIITLIGDNPQTIEQGAGYTELGATTSDGSTVTINTTEFADLVGTYHIYYDSTDTAGNNAIQVNRTVIVSDTTPPVISLLGDNPQTIEQGAGYTELGATTSDGSTVTINTTEFADLVGTYHIYYDSTDTAGNNAIQVNRTVIVSDTTSPIITLIGGNPQTIEQGAGYTELNATTSDGSTVTINTTEFADLVGTYHIYYDSTDTAGNNAIQVNRTVIVSDTTSPIITLIGDNPQTIEQGAGYTELNAIASDGSTVTINSANFTDLVGTYHIYYDSADTAGNNAIQVNRTVIVSDTTPPTFSSAVLNEGTGIFTITFSEIINASSINSTGFSIRDNNTSTGAVTLSSLEQTTTVNDTTISFNMTLANRQSVIAFNVSVLDIGAGAVQDINANAITSSANNTITTTLDSIPPVISLIGDNPQTIEQGAGYTELNATTSDGSTVTINSANFTDAVGNYTIYYDSTDAFNNSAIQVSRTVNVVDTTPPTFSSAVLNEGTGIFTITFSEIINASSINSTGFSIRDNNTSTGAVTLSSLEQTTTVNDTTISFNMTLANRQSVIAFNVSVLDIGAGAVQDINANAITSSANNTITTTLDSIPPVISLIGDNPQTIEQGAGYTELNATTSDGSTVTINSANFTDLVGTYHIYYDSADTAGNNAIQVNRTVIVSDTTPPTFSSAVLNEGTGIFTITFSEIINASSINSTGFSIRDNNTSTGAVTLSSLEQTTTVNDTTISFNMTLANRQSVIAFNVSVLDIGAGAVQDINANAITSSANNTITTTLDSIPPVISLIGDNPQTIEQGAGYTELNATTNDGSTVTINSANFTDAVGNYTIYYDSTDAFNNSAIQVSRTVNVVDTTPPTFSSAVLNEGTGIFTITFSEIINASSINSTGFSIRDNNTGTGAVTLSSLEQTTTVNDTTISFNMTLANRQSVIAFNVSVLDIGAGAVQDINANAITSSANNTITTTLDSIPPVISLIGDNPQTIEQGAGYTELNATTSDGSTVTINSANFTDLVGTYHIYYDSADTAGNNAIQVNRTVIVSDTTPPTFSSAVLNEGTGIFTITFSEIINASSINSTGFSIRDNNTSTGAVTLSSLEQTTTVNDTTISFNMTLINRQSVIAFNVSVLDIGAGAVQDINANAITSSANNTITTTLDSIPPVISLIGDNPQTIEQGAGYTELNATTNDGSTVTINSANFTDAVGNYTIYYDSTDAFNNSAIQVSRTVNVVDTTPPTFSSAVLNEGTGIFTITFSEIINASSINSTGFSIRDNNTSTGAVTLSSLEQTTTVNDTTISFNMTLANRQSVIAFNVSVLDIGAGAVRDIFDNAITLSANNTITTTLDSIPPVISLIGDNPQTIEQGAGYTELNATTNDGSTVTINSANFTDAVGNYTIYYDSTDAFNNSAIQVSRTVNVVDTTPPTFSSAVLNEGTGIFTITFNESINISTINSTGLYIRDAGITVNGVILSISELITTINNATISFTLTEANRQLIITFTMPQLDINAAAVSDVHGNLIVVSADNSIAVITLPEPPTPCDVSGSGDWIITTSCTLSTNHVTATNVIIQNNSVLVISNGTILDIDFANNSLTVKSGSGVLIESGGTIT